MLRICSTAAAYCCNRLLQQTTATARWIEDEEYKGLSCLEFGATSATDCCNRLLQQLVVLRIEEDKGLCCLEFGAVLGGVVLVCLFAAE